MVPTDPYLCEGIRFLRTANLRGRLDGGHAASVIPLMPAMGRFRSYQAPAAERPIFQHPLSKTAGLLPAIFRQLGGRAAHAGNQKPVASGAQLLEFDVVLDVAPKA